MHNNVNILSIIISSVIIFSCSSFYTCLGQDVSDTCNGIFISYNYTGGRSIHPREDDPKKQPYRFQSTLTLLNNGLDELKTWRVFLGFQHDEMLVEAENAILDDGSYFPASVGSGTVLRGSPAVSDLKTAVETAGDVNKMSVKVNLVGTEFGVEPSDIPMPRNLTLVNEGYSCPSPNRSTGSTEMTLCCSRNLAPEPNPSQDEEDFSLRQDGDLTIMYDVIKSYDANYWAQVTIANHNPLGRLDDWNLSWEWQKQEFIYAMKGAYPKLVDTTDCIFGPQGQYYKDFDFSSALNCERIPTIFDLPPTRANDTNLGMVPSCCRNGTILPPSMDKTRSVSVFQMQVYKMPPDLNRTRLNPPVNWRINGTMSSDYQCGQPIQVSPSQFPDPTALPSEVSAVSSWQVVCNITKSRETPKCCVSFSAFYNDSVVPCNTCACGCNSITSNTCSPTAPAVLLQPKTILLPFENRTKEAKAWAELKHLPFPDTLPCGDNCGININWHINSDYRDGWTARITVFNWGKTEFADWFVGVQLDKAAPGFKKVYSFNGSRYNDTILMQGLPGLKYLLSAKDGSNPRKDFRVPGTQQSVILFNKKNLPRIDVATGDGFPTKVLFNGEECSLPTILPSKGLKISTSAFSLVFVLVLSVFC